MLLIDSFVSQALSTQPRVHKAPRGFMYFIESVAIIVNSPGNNTLIIIDYAVEDEKGVQNIDDNMLVAFATNTELTIQVVGINHQTKFISETVVGTTAFNGHIFIYGELVKATRTQLLIEWFRKGR